MSNHSSLTLAAVLLSSLALPAFAQGNVNPAPAVAHRHVVAKRPVHRVATTTPATAPIAAVTTPSATAPATTTTPSVVAAPTPAKPGTPAPAVKPAPAKVN